MLAQNYCKIHKSKLKGMTVGERKGKDYSNFLWLSAKYKAQVAEELNAAAVTDWRSSL